MARKSFALALIVLLVLPTALAIGQEKTQSEAAIGSDSQGVLAESLSFQTRAPRAEDEPQNNRPLRELREQARYENLVPREFRERLRNIDQEKLRSVAEKISSENARKVFENLDNEKLERLAQNPELARKLSGLSAKEIEKIAGLPLDRLENALSKVRLSIVREKFLENRKDFLDKKSEFVDSKLKEVEFRARLQVAKEAFQNAAGEKKTELKENFNEKVVEYYINRLGQIASMIELRLQEEENAELTTFLEKIRPAIAALSDDPTRQEVSQAKLIVREFLSKFWEKHKANRASNIFEKTGLALERLAGLDEKAQRLLAELKEKRPDSGLVNAFETRLENLSQSLERLQTEYDALKGEFGENPTAEQQRQILKLAHAAKALSIRYHNFLRALAKFSSFEKQGKLNETAEQEIEDELSEVEEVSPDQLLVQAEQEITEQEQAQVAEEAQIAVQATQSEEQEVEQVQAENIDDILINPAVE